MQLSIDPLGQPTVMVNSAHYKLYIVCTSVRTCTYVSTFENRSKYNNSREILIAAGGTVGLSKGIIDETSFSSY